MNPSPTTWLGPWLAILLAVIAVAPPSARAQQPGATPAPPKEEEVPFWAIGRPASGPFTSGGRRCDIRWSSFFLDDIPRELLVHPLYCVVQVNNVLNNPLKEGEDRWVAYPRPQVVFQYYDGRTGQLHYAEAVTATK